MIPKKKIQKQHLCFHRDHTHKKKNRSEVNTEKETFNLGNIKTNWKYTHATFTKYISELIFTAQIHPPKTHTQERGLFDTCTLLFACINTHHAN